MSALTLPMIHSTRAEGTSQPIAAEKILSIDKIVLPAIPNASKSDFKIIFSMQANSNPGKIEWRYLLEADLDTDLAAILVLVSTVVP